MHVYAEPEVERGRTCSRPSSASARFRLRVVTARIASAPPWQGCCIRYQTLRTLAGGAGRSPGSQSPRAERGRQTHGTGPTVWLCPGSESPCSRTQNSLRVRMRRRGMTTSRRARGGGRTALRGKQTAQRDPCDLRSRSRISPPRHRPNRHPTPWPARARAQGTRPAAPAPDRRASSLDATAPGRTGAVRLMAATRDDAGEIEREIRVASGIEQGSVHGPGSRGRRRLYRTESVRSTSGVANLLRDGRRGQ